ncbi:MAG: M15 family metallopeptidase [Phycisphaerales bacterium]
MTRNVKMSKYLILIFVFSFLFAGTSFAELNLDCLSQSDVNKVETIINTLKPLIKERDEKHTLASLTFKELYSPLNKSQKKFLKQFETLDANLLSVKIPFLGMAKGNEDFVIITGQQIKIKGERAVIPPQFVPKDVNESYTKMMDAMQKDIGKRLYIESAYRSSAYQLYILIDSLKNHKYSIRETVKYVALPGFSEHGCPRVQALDFISEEGINGDGCPEQFEALAENDWLLKNAHKFNFVLSYPKDAKAGITYEPWHWRFTGNDSAQTSQN